MSVNVCVCAGVSSCGKTCEGESDHQWLGVSLSRQPGGRTEDGGHVLVGLTRLGTDTDV